MAKAMTKSQLIAKVAENASLSKKAAREILDFIAETAYKEAKNSFTLPGLGKLVLVHQRGRTISSISLQISMSPSIFKEFLPA